MRLKSRWSKQNKSHSVEEIAGALAFIIFRTATDGMLNLENADFQTDTQSQRLDVMTEYIAFAIHIADRMTFEQFTEVQRQKFMTELAKKCAVHLEDNRQDTEGEGDHQQQFIDLLNQRMGDYAEFPYTEEDGPSFGMKRFFGDRVAEVIGEKHKRWVGDQIIELEVPEILDYLRRATPNLFA